MKKAREIIYLAFLLQLCRAGLKSLQNCFTAGAIITVLSSHCMSILADNTIAFLSLINLAHLSSEIDFSGGLLLNIGR